MRLRWTLVAAGARGVPVDAVVECPEGATWAELEDRTTPAGLVGLTAPVVAEASGTRLTASTVVGCSPLVDGAVVTLRPGAPARSPGPSRRTPPEVAGVPRPLLELAVLAGPDAGRSFVLSAGRLTCGRSPTNDVALTDPRLSRSHCSIVLGADGVALEDLGSTNGTAVPGSRLGPAAGSVPLRLGERCRLGASLVVLRGVQDDAPAVGRPDAARGGPDLDAGIADGTLAVRRGPRRRPPEVGQSVRLPAPARAGRAVAFPVLAVLLPAFAGAALSMWTGSAVYLLLAGLGPLMVAGGWWTSRRTARRDGLMSGRDHARECDRLRGLARSAARDLADARLHRLPDAVSLLRMTERRSERLWERSREDEDAVRVRLGTTDTDTDTTGAAPTPSALRPQVTIVDHTGAVEPVATPDDLVSVDLRQGSLGIVEPLGDPSLTRFVVGQLAALLPPEDMSVVTVLGPSAAARWRWAWLLPHVRPEVADLPGVAPGGHVWPTPARETARAVGELVATRKRAPTGDRGPAGHRRPWRSVVVVVDDPDGELISAELEWAAEAHAVDVHVLVVGSDRRVLPPWCHHLVVAGSADGVDMVVVRTSDETSATFVADRVAPRWAERHARAMAPLRLAVDAGARSLPASVRLHELLGTDAASVSSRWAAERAGSLEVPIGVGVDEVVCLDLVRAGPHALVAGTTGAGKSELLRSWLLAMAATHPPERVSFLLIDYKGGATFDELRRLPHTVGLLTDLDSGATTRVLHSLRAEVRRRERLLAGAGVRDLDGYRTANCPGQPLPRLLVVVDEFRILSEEAPLVLAEFVRLAATGRSLGIHLVLATQRPGGVVSADIRANAGLRIALRVQDASESRDVIERPDAAALPAESPGRAILVGSGLDVTVQGAWVGPSAGSAPPWRLDAVSTSPPVDPVSEQNLSPSPAPSPAAAVVDAVIEAAARDGRTPARPPWLPPLPSCIETGDEPVPTADRARAGLLLGTTDLPWAQARGQLVWDPVRHGPGLVLGGPRSGRSTTLRTAASEATRLGATALRLSGEDDDDHTVDLLRALVALRAEAPSQGTLQVLLLLDDADALLDPSTDPLVVDLLVQLLRGGHREGVGVLLAGGRGLAVSRLAAGARVRIVHRTTDRADALVAGVPSGASPTSWVPGRCLVLGLPEADAVGAEPGCGDPQHVGPPAAAGEVGVSPAALEAQVHLPRDASDQTTAAAGRCSGPTATLVLPVRLPDRVVAGSLPPPASASRRARASAPEATALLPLGLVAPTGNVWSLRVGRSPSWVVAGPAGSGRSTALRQLSREARAAGAALAWLAPTAGRGGPRDQPGSASSRPLDLLVVDDADQLDPAALAELESWLVDRTGPLAGALSPGGTVVLAGTTEWLAGEFRGVPAVLRRHGQGLVLHAGRTDTRDVLGVRTSLTQRSRLPGRGLLVDRGRVTRIQVAVPGTDPEPAPDLGVRDARTPGGDYRSGDEPTGGPTP